MARTRENAFFFAVVIVPDTAVSLPPVSVIKADLRQRYGCQMPSEYRLDATIPF